MHIQQAAGVTVYMNTLIDNSLPVLSTGQASCPTSPQVGPSVGGVHPVIPQYRGSFCVTVYITRCVVYM